MTGISTAAAVDTGRGHACALLSDGTVRCWGNNERGQLGNGTTANSEMPVEVTGISDAKAIAVGDFHSCALLANGKMKCWGFNLHGQLGNGTNGANADSSTPVAVSGLADVASIGAGGDKTCAVRTSGVLACWGFTAQMFHGVLGEGPLPTPTTVTGIADAVSVSPGDSHTCVVHKTGTVSCWGINNRGQVGDGTTTERLTAVPVKGLSNVASISSGKYHTCAVLASGTIECWGSSGDGNDNASTTLGDGSTAESSTPVTVKGITTAKSVSAGDNHTCALLEGGIAECWGNNQDGQVGSNEVSGPSTPTPVRVEFLS